MWQSCSFLTLSPLSKSFIIRRFLVWFPKRSPQNTDLIGEFIGMRRNAWMLVIIMIAVLLGVNNTVYYFTTKHALEDGLRHELDSIAKQIGVSVESSRGGAEIYQVEIGRELRAASIAVQYALSPDVDKVMNDQLAELAKKLDMVDITLLKRTADNIVLYKSSDPKELGYKTDSWDPWYKAFNQLFDDKQVSIDWGQKLNNFWTGPFEYSTTTADEVQKWGYYYDGTTNYITDPYINYGGRQREYDEATGVNHLIAKTLQANSSLEEITMINPTMFPFGREKTTNDNGEKVDHMTQFPIISGSYTFKHDNDVDHVRLAYEKDVKVYQNARINGKHVIKLFIPIDIDTKVASMVDAEGKPIGRYVLSVVADYAIIQDKLDKQLVNVGIIVGSATILSLLLLYAVMMAYRKTQDRLVRKTQETYLEEMGGLFQSIRSQRHDFLNHVQTIRSLAELGKLEELQAYASELTGEIDSMNEIINIGNPAIAALIRAKLLQAELMKVEMVTDFSNLNRLELGIKSLDMTRLLGNLIDNAFDEVMKYEEGNRRIRISAIQEETYYQFAISNTCYRNDDLIDKPLFKAGYTSKDDAHSGLGLHIVKSIIERYNGEIMLALDEPGTITFVIKIPS